jgi:hypothetical protein
MRCRHVQEEGVTGIVSDWRSPAAQQETCMKRRGGRCRNRMVTQIRTVVRPAEEAFRFRVLSFRPTGMNIIAAAVHRMRDGKLQERLAAPSSYEMLLKRRSQTLASHRVSRCEHIAMIHFPSLAHATVNSEQ